MGRRRGEEGGVAKRGDVLERSDCGLTGLTDDRAVEQGVALDRDRHIGGVRTTEGDLDRCVGPDDVGIARLRRLGDIAMLRHRAEAEDPRVADDLRVGGGRGVGIALGRHAVAWPVRIAGQHEVGCVLEVGCRVGGVDFGILGRLRHGVAIETEVVAGGRDEGEIFHALFGLDDDEVLRGGGVALDAAILARRSAEQLAEVRDQFAIGVETVGIRAIAAHFGLIGAVPVDPDVFRGQEARIRGGREPGVEVGDPHDPLRAGEVIGVLAAVHTSQLHVARGMRDNLDLAEPVERLDAATPGRGDLARYVDEAALGHDVVEDEAIILEVIGHADI